MRGYTTLAFAVAALGVAACGEDASPTGRSEGASSDAAVAPTQATVRLDGETDQSSREAEAAIRRVVSSIYDTYVTEIGTGEAFPDGVETAELRRAVEAASDPETGGLGFDFYCSCQDYGDVSYDIAGVAVDGDEATTAVDFHSFGQLTQIELRLRKVGGRWQVDDVIDPNGSLRQSLQAG